MVFFLLPSPYCHLAYFSCFDLRIPLLGHCDHSGAIHPDCRFPTLRDGILSKSLVLVQSSPSSKATFLRTGGCWSWRLRKNYANELSSNSMMLLMYIYTYIDIYIYIYEKMYIFILRYICIQYSRCFLRKDTVTLQELLGFFFGGESLTKWCQMTESQYCT